MGQEETYELLRQRGPMTARDIAEIVGCSPSDINRDLHQLSKFRMATKTGKTKVGWANVDLWSAIQ